jgi:hypothetical protein
MTISSIGVLVSNIKDFLFWKLTMTHDDVPPYFDILGWLWADRGLSITGVCPWK